MSEPDSPKREITLREALHVWLDWRRSGTATESLGQLFELFVEELSASDREAILGRVDGSVGWLRDAIDLLESPKEAVASHGWDIALPKAAASDTARAAMHITSEGGKYTIEIRPHVDESDRGIIVVRVSEFHREQLEGCELMLKDSDGRVLLEGRVVAGEVSREIDALSRIQYGFVVQARAAAG